MSDCSVIEPKFKIQNSNFNCVNRWIQKIHHRVSVANS